MKTASTASLETAAGRPTRRRLFYAVFAAYSLHFSTGAIMGWASPSIPRLSLTPSQVSLLSSLFSLGAAPGLLITTFGIDTIGRRGTLFAVSAAFLVSWLVLLSSQNIVVMYIARLVGGAGIGGAFAGVSLYVAEISDDQTRGPLGSLLQTFLGVGLLVEYCIGPYTSYTILAVSSLGVTCLFLVLFFFAPESPHYLVAKGRMKEAYSALTWLRGDIPDEDINREITQIQKALKLEEENVSGGKKLFTSAAVHRGIGICFLLVMMQQGSAMNALLGRVESVFQLADIHLSPQIVAILVGLTNLFASLPAPLLVKRFGNKDVFVASTFGCGICQCLLGLYFSLRVNNYDVSYIGFLPVVSIILFNVSFCIGLGPLVWGFAADLFSPSVKGMCMGICGAFSAVFGFAAIEIFSRVLDTFGPVIVFFSFGGYLLVGGVCTVLFLPEISQMTLQEIQEYLEGRR